MPQRYAGHRLPWLLAQPLELAVALICLLGGLAINVDPSRTPASIDLMPGYINTGFRGILVAGGIFVAIGVARSHRQRWSYTLERVGMYFSATAFALYGLALAAGGVQTALFAILIMALLSVACVIKGYALGIDSKNRLAGIRRIPTKGDG